MPSSYDYMITGSGLAGLSLLYQLLNDERLKQKKILLIDPVKKNQNDRTWCFWEKEAGPFEHLVCHQWNTLEFFSDKISRTFTMQDYRYKMIQAGDFYNHVLTLASQFDNVTFLHEKITSINSNKEKAIVKTGSGEYTADYAFNSTGLFHPVMNEKNTLLQHFLGWYIETKEEVFDPGIATLMDFRLEQHHGTTFMYVLPVSSTKALVEYTLFSPRTLKESEYIKEIRKYLKERLKVGDYEVTHSEFGVIPMSMARFPKYPGGHNRIINLGTAGGYTKASTGYTFQFVQKHVQQIAERLKKNQSPAKKPSFRDRMFDWYDLTLLDVLMSGRLTGRQIFSGLFKNVPPERILAFLANESSFWEEFRIRNSVPMLPFMISGMKQLVMPGK